MTRRKKCGVRDTVALQWARVEAERGRDGAGERGELFSLRCPASLPPVFRLVEVLVLVHKQLILPWDSHFEQTIDESRWSSLATLLQSTAKMMWRRCCRLSLFLDLDRYRPGPRGATRSGCRRFSRLDGFIRLALLSSQNSSF